MTFAVVQTERNEARVIGNVWACDEAVAKSMVTLLLSKSVDALSIRRTEERELPLKVPGCDT